MGIQVPVIAKIERPEALANLPQIISAYDGIMVARGDLGIELPIQDVPIIHSATLDVPAGIHWTGQTANLRQTGDETQRTLFTAGLWFAWGERY